VANLADSFVKLEKRQPSGREKDEASIRLLAQLRDKLYSEHVGTARRAAFNLSWMQEDGLDILREALFSNAVRRTKSAAAYGLRKMRGRMEKAALEVLTQGLKFPDKTTAVVCGNALMVLKGGPAVKIVSKGKKTAGRFEIKQVPAKSRSQNRQDSFRRTNKQRNNSSKRRF
jgi:hypothetical protein